MDWSFFYQKTYLCFGFFSITSVALLVRFTTGRFIHEYDPTLGKFMTCLFH